MAKVEKDFLERKNPTERNFKAKPFMPRKPIPDLGHEKLDGKRFYTQDFMQKEWDSIWRKTWQLVCREADLKYEGSFITHEIGKESFLIVKGNDGKIRAFYNVCQHRGNKLCQIEEGELEIFSCPFHGWKWNNDGSLNSVFAPELYKQFEDGVPVNELGLTEVKLDSWGGWLWLNMDDKSISLKEWLGEYGEHLESYNFEKWELIDYQTFEWNGNWKHAWDAFNESYHFESLHPDMIEFGEGHDIPIELLGIHSRMLNFNRTVSEVVEDQTSLTEIRAHMWGLKEDVNHVTNGENVVPFDCAAKDVHLEEIRRRRASEEDSYLPFKQMNDEQLVHQYHYSFFPGTTFTQIPEFGAVFRYRPHASDPNICYYDFFILAHLPPDTPKPERPEHRIHRHTDGIDYIDAFDGTFDPVFAKVLSEDGSNMTTMQDGVKSDSFQGMILSDQEIRIRHFHKIIDDFLSGAIDAHNLPNGNAYLDT